MPSRLQMVVGKLEEEMEGRPELAVTALEALSNMPLTDAQQVRPSALRSVRRDDQGVGEIELGADQVHRRTGSSQFTGRLQAWPSAAAAAAHRLQQAADPQGFVA